MGQTHILDVQYRNSVSKWWFFQRLVDLFQKFSNNSVLLIICLFANDSLCFQNNFDIVRRHRDGYFRDAHAFFLDGPARTKRINCDIRERHIGPASSQHYVTINIKVEPEVTQTLERQSIIFCFFSLYVVGRMSKSSYDVILYWTNYLKRLHL